MRTSSEMKIALWFENAKLGGMRSPLVRVLSKKLGSSVRTQLFMTTHSPIVLASLKDLFDSTLDKRFDLYLKEGAVSIRDGA